MFGTQVHRVLTVEPGPLLVLVPAVGQTCDHWLGLRERLSQEPQLAGADWLLYNHNLRAFSSRTLWDAAVGLAAKIREFDEYEATRPSKTYSQIILIGHGAGGLLVRMAYLIGAGAVDGKPLPWSQKVSRLILFATLNRGFDPRRWGWLSFPIRGLLLMPWFRFGRSYMKGSSNIANLRISWINHFRQFENRYAQATAAAAGGPAGSFPGALQDGSSPASQPLQPVVIQINGAHDRQLNPSDNADIDQFSRATQVTLQGVGRADVFHGWQDEVRYTELRHQILTAQGDSLSPHTDASPEIKDVVFLVHGIRACNSDWPRRAAEILQRDFSKVIPITAGYSYFSALNFAVPFMRRLQIRWMQDEYSNQFAKYRNARFYFIGHSNGTYLLGRLLDRVPSVKFERVTLVGSVLPQSFDWESHLEKRVMDYRNHRAASDMPVGLLCSLLRGCFMSDIGTAGFNGFLPGDLRREVFYYKGGHGSALKDTKNLAELIRYTLLGGTPTYAVTPDLQPGVMSLLSRTMPYVPSAVVAALALAFYFGVITLTSTLLWVSGIVLVMLLLVLKVA